MKRTRLAALFLCLAGLVFALTGVACISDDTNEEWSFTANVPVVCEEGDTVTVEAPRGAIVYTVKKIER